MSFPNTIMQQTRRALEATKEANEPIKEFAAKIKDIIADRSGTGHIAGMDVVSDITFLYRIAKDNEFADRQLIKLVANYVERSLDKDPSSRQDPTKNFTYMKSIRN